MATATMAYSYKAGKWEVWSVFVPSGVPYMDAKTCSRLMTEDGAYLYPVIVDAPITSFSIDKGKYCAVIRDDFDMPEVFTLEQSIERNKKFLSNIVKREA